ncbi:hypothetical protein AAZX31_12G196800 [Glycine max]|uniref:Uncharacterized protein n=2 Tax=Glycine subgen. Soja TaxID=1462606 RepID=K7LW55_SOYBN|nr:hypothetical protein GYH30_034424 [Glycine max]KRH27012.1 hypothetical protein GLYMA_12G208300v4 [Glycine max]RZB76888.1 hypothetical protein D0Y65_035028 [Glycine soja]
MSCEREEKERPLVKDHVMPPCELFAPLCFPCFVPKSFPHVGYMPNASLSIKMYVSACLCVSRFGNTFEAQAVKPFLLLY